MREPNGVLVEVFRLPDDQAAAWRDWTDRTLLPARAQIPGVLAVRRGVGVVGSVSDLILYDLADADVPSSPAWREVDTRLFDDRAKGSANDIHASNTDARVYRLIWSSAESYQPPKTEILHGAFFKVAPEHHDEFNDWYKLEHVPAILSADPGYLNVRRFQGIDDPRDFLALYDVTTLEVAEGKKANDAMQSPWSDRVRAKLVLERERRLFRIERLIWGQAD